MRWVPASVPGIQIRQDLLLLRSVRVEILWPFELFLMQRVDFHLLLLLQLAEQVSLPHKDCAENLYHRPAQPITPLIDLRGPKPLALCLLLARRSVSARLLLPQCLDPFPAVLPLYTPCTPGMLPLA